MRFLLILLALPVLTLAQDRTMAKAAPRPKAGVQPANINLGAGFGGALQAPVLLQPPAGYPLNGQLGQYHLPVSPEMFSQCPPGMNCPGIPGYLAHFNRGIPGMAGPNQPASGFNILRYGPNPNDPNQTQMPQQYGRGGGGGGMGQQNPLSGLMRALGGGGNNRGITPASADSGPSYIGNEPGNFQGTPVNSGPDGLCHKPGLFQTTPKAELNGETPCQVITNIITRDPCTAPLADSLASGTIEDMEEFCPGWNQLKGDREKRGRMLTALVAAIVKTESSWRPDTRGDGGNSRGLLQLTRATDQGKGCSCGRLQNEFDIRQNLECGTHMIISYMARDRTVGRGTGERGARGIARSFGPFRDGRRERPDIIRRVSGYCRSLQQGAPPSDNVFDPPATSWLQLQPRELICSY